MPACGRVEAKVKAWLFPARKRTRNTQPKKADEEWPDGKLLLPSWIMASTPVQISRVASHWHLEKKSGLKRPTRPLMKSAIGESQWRVPSR